MNLSGEGFTAERDGRALRPGLSYCRALSQKAVSAILAERGERPFASVADLYCRTPVERGALENLIGGGFLDRLHPRGEAGRAALLGETRGLPAKRRRGSQRELPLPHPASWWESREGRGSAVAALPPSVTDLERWEARILGLDLRRHPLCAHREALGALGVVPGRQLRDLPHGTRARAAGVLECLQAPPTRSGALVHFLLTEDESGLLQSTIFERCYRHWGHLLYETGAYLLEGRVDQDQRRGFSFVVEKICALAASLEAYHSGTPEARSTTPPALSSSVRLFVRPTPERKEPNGRMRRQGRRRCTPEGQGAPASPTCRRTHQRGCAERAEIPWPHPSFGLDKQMNHTYD